MLFNGVQNKRSPLARYPVGCPSSPKLKEKVDREETSIRTYFDVAEAKEKPWHNTSRGCNGTASEEQFNARQEARKASVSAPASVSSPVRTPVCDSSQISRDPDITNRGDNENMLSFASSRSVSMFPPPLTIEHDVPTTMKDSAGTMTVKIVKTHTVRKNYDCTSKRGSTQRPNWKANWIRVRELSSTQSR